MEICYNFLSSNVIVIFRNKKRCHKFLTQILIVMEIQIVWIKG